MAKLKNVCRRYLYHVEGVAEEPHSKSALHELAKKSQFMIA